MNLTTSHAMSNTSPASAKSLVRLHTPVFKESFQALIKGLFLRLSIMVDRLQATSVGRFSLNDGMNLFSVCHPIHTSVSDLNQRGFTMSNLAVFNTEIRQQNNLYSLNDLHEVSGKAKKHQPSLFLANAQTKSLINEIDFNSDLGIPRSVQTKRGGLNQGTFVCKELVYAYAMWISPKFNLQVIRAFDQIQNQPPRIENTVNIGDYHKRGMEQIKASQALAKANAHKPKPRGIEYYYRKAMGMPPRVEK